MGPLFILAVIFSQTVGTGQVTLFERAIAFVRAIDKNYKDAKIFILIYRNLESLINPTIRY